MLLHPINDRHLLTTYAGTRLLRTDFGIIGVAIPDPFVPERVWTIQAAYAPVGRAIGGIRVKLTDAHGFVTFCNQRDLEVLLELGTPGRWCKWLGQEYVEPGEREWFGLCADGEDLIDDLFDREMLLRQEYGPILPQQLELVRRLHLGHRADFEELRLLLWDMDTETGECPDGKIETIERRWSRVQREKIEWDRL